MKQDLLAKIRNRAFLVTGGAGFIGSNLTELLLKHGAARVRVLDNFSTGYRKNLAACAAFPAFELQEGDIRNVEDCRRAVQEVEIVFHQAALGSVPRSIHDPVTTDEVNIGGFLKMLTAAREAGAASFVYAASSSVYGDSATLPKVEETIGRPLSPYAVTKLVDELYAEVFQRCYGFSSIGLRYFNVFGRRQDPDGAYAAVIPRFAKAFLRHEPPQINGDGGYSRDFTYIDNVLQANLLAAFAPPEARNRVYNIACGDRTTLNELAGELRRRLAQFDASIAEVPILHGSIRPGDIPHSLASIDRARQLLGYEPEFSFSRGLAEAAEWYYRNLQ